MRLPDTAHADRPWRVHALTADFRLEDVWRLPTPGGPGDLGLLVQALADGDTASDSRLASALWAVRWKLGALLGWDDEAAGTRGRVHSLRHRLDPELAAAPTGPAFRELPFTSLYLLEDEWAAEIANATMHGVMHLGWVEHEGAWTAQMAVLVKPNGLLGRAYMAAINPFRHLVVYPPLLRQIERTWRERGPAALSAA